MRIFLLEHRSSLPGADESPTGRHVAAQHKARDSSLRGSKRQLHRARAGRLFVPRRGKRHGSVLGVSDDEPGAACQKMRISLRSSELLPTGVRCFRIAPRTDTRMPQRKHCQPYLVGLSIRLARYCQSSCRRATADVDLATSFGVVSALLAGRRRSDFEAADVLNTNGWRARSPPACYLERNNGLVRVLHR